MLLANIVWFSLIAAMLSSRKVFLWFCAALLLHGAVPAILVIMGYEMRVGSRAALVAPVLLAGCLLFIAGVWMGGRCYPIPVHDSSQVPLSSVRMAVYWLAAIACVMFGYLVVTGAPPFVLKLIGGADSTGLLIAREHALKLNPHKLQVRVICMLRDMIGPTLLILSVASFRAKQLRLVEFLATTIIVILSTTWSGQKSPIVFALVALCIWEAHSLKALYRQILCWGPVAVFAIIVAGIATQPDLLKSSANATEYFGRLLNGLIERIFVTPFEVTATHFMASALGDIGWREAIPSYAFIWQPASETADAYIGRTYFSGGYSSTLSGALCFSYPYVMGSLALCFLLGLGVVPLLALSARMVGTSCPPVVRLCFSAYLTLLIVDGVHGNLIQYLINNLAVAAGVMVVGGILTRVGLFQRFGLEHTSRPPGFG